MAPASAAEAANGNPSESRHFPITGTATDGIYVQGREVMFKNVPDAAGKPQNYSFGADDVALVFHQASFMFAFLGIGITSHQSSYLVLCNVRGDMLAAVPPDHKSVHEFLVHLIALNPRIQLDKYVSRYAAGDSSVLWRRMMKKWFVAVAANVAVWSTIIFLAVQVSSCVE